MTLAAPGVALEVGDYAPVFELRAADGTSQGLTSFLGRSILVLFYPKLDALGAREEVAAVERRAGELDQRGIKAMIVTRDVGPTDASPAPSVPTLHDRAGKLFEAYGLPATGTDEPQGAEPRTVFLLDPSLRVVSRYQGQPAEAIVDQVVADHTTHVAPAPPRDVFMHAPVLLVPGVLPPELCRRLIEVWETQGNVDSGSMVTRDGKTVPVYNYDHKIRRDHFMQGGPDEDAVKKYVGRRVLPEMRKAFNYNVTRREDFRIACYDASRGGYFRPHRDNTTEGTAHRRFAMSLLLNDDYEGGYLRFPEYGPDRYRPRAGGAVIFSCSLLHEATDVTAGRRFVLLSFFYGEAEAKVREEYNKKTGGVYRA